MPSIDVVAVGRNRLTEEQIINLIHKALHNRVLPKDDVVALKDEGGLFILKSEMLVSSTDIPPGMSLKQAGRKAVAAAVSDFAAKGVRPLAALLSLAIPRGLSRRDLQELAEGFRGAQREFDVPILGGDTNEGPELIIDCSLFGKSDHIISRGGAKDGDVVMVSGSFGYSRAGLEILLQGMGERDILVETAVNSVLEPKPQLKLGLALAKRKIIRASIDSSDGLAFSLHQLAEASGLGIRLTSLPYDDGVVKLAKLLSKPLEELVLYGGEEFHLIFAVPRDKVGAAQTVARKVGGQLKPIGRFDKSVKGVIGVEGRLIERRGWLHLTC